LDDIGRGDYGVMQASWNVLLTTPYQVYLFFPVASLLGSLLGLGHLANHRELIVMRSAGVSIARISLSVLKVAVVLIVTVTILGETLIPNMLSQARDQKMQAIEQRQVFRAGQGVWLRYQNDFLRLGQVSSDNTLLDVMQFHFDAEHKLRVVRKIDSLTYQQGQWQASGVLETQLDDDHSSARAMDKLTWDVPLNPRVLRVTQREPDEMRIRELRDYLHTHEKQSGTTYALAYWQRLVQPLTTVVMMLLAIPFIFGPLRASTMGAKLVTGISIGFGFHLMNRFLGPISQVLQWPAIIPALCPTLLFGMLSLVLIKRQ